MDVQVPKMEKDNGSKKRVKKMISIETKKEIISKHENGFRISDLASHFMMSTSTICSILKKREIIKKANVAKGVMVITKKRPPVIDKVEQLLLIWINDNLSSGTNVTEHMICEKARQLHDDLVKANPEVSGENCVFKASKGWLGNFKRRSGIKSIVKHEDAESVKLNDAEEFKQNFKDYITAHGYVSQQVFNCDKTLLFWKRMPKRTYLTQEEKASTGRKPMNDRLTLLLCGNASGDLKIKPLVVYHSDTPRAFKKNRVVKSWLPVMWRTNNKCWITRHLFIEWMQKIFAPSVKKYLRNYNLPVKCLLLIDNASLRFSGSADELVEEFDFVTMIFLPSNVVTLIQPMSQNIITNFKKLYTKVLFQKCLEMTSDTDLSLRDFWKHHYNILECLTLIHKTWEQVSLRTMNLGWSKLWPECIICDNFEGLEKENCTLVEEIVSLGKSLGLEVNNEDVEDLLEEFKDELSTEDLVELERQLRKSGRESPEEKEETTLVEGDSCEKVPSILIEEMCIKWGEVQNFVEQYHPDKAMASRSINVFNSLMWDFRNMLRQRRQKVTSDNCSVDETLYGTEPEFVAVDEIKIKVEPSTDE